MNSLEIIYQDEHLVAINKPHGLMVHRSKMSANTDEFALQMTRDQIGQKVYPVHRLDRKTSGVLVFALNPEAHKILSKQFENQETQKNYIAIVRGYTLNQETIDYALTNENGKTQDAITEYETIAKNEIPVPFGKFETSRYSLVKITPKTGRFHQIRKHFAHLRHPIIGDRPHGCNKQNRLFKERWDMITMMLHAKSLTFVHPVSNEQLTITASIHKEFERTLGFLGLELP